MFKTYIECGSDRKITINLDHIIKVRWIDSWKTFGAVAIVTMSDCSDDIVLTEPKHLEAHLSRMNSKKGFGILL